MFHSTAVTFDQKWTKNKYSACASCPWRTLYAESSHIWSLTNVRQNRESSRFFEFLRIIRCRKAIERRIENHKHEFCWNTNANTGRHDSHCEAFEWICRTRKVFVSPYEITIFSFCQWNVEFSRKIWWPFDCASIDSSISTIISIWFSLNSAMIDDKIWEF